MLNSFTLNPINYLCPFKCLLLFHTLVVHYARKIHRRVYVKQIVRHIDGVEIDSLVHA